MTPSPADLLAHRPARLQRITGRPTDPYPVVFVDAHGRPDVALTEWYRCVGQRKAIETRETYASCLLRWRTYLEMEGIPWDAPFEQLQAAIVAYHITALRCHVAPDPGAGQVTITCTAETPLQDSTLAVLRAAIRSFYAVLIDEGLYRGPNPLTAVVLARLATVRSGHRPNAGAPAEAGISDPRHGRRRTPAFVRHPAHRWIVDWQQTTVEVAAGIHVDLDAMISHPSITERDRAVLLLLLHTGARVHEIVQMTVGGYRAGGIAGEALVRTKGSRGREVKTIYFGQAPSVQRALHRYRDRERVRWDRQQRALDAVGAPEPFFLSRRGTPYTTDAFYQQWYRLYGAVAHHCPRPFSPHDLRHLMVTECLRLAREQCAGDGEAYLRAKNGLADLMGWRDPRTVEIYDHSLEPERALALVAARTQRLEEGCRVIGLPPPPEDKDSAAPASREVASSALAPVPASRAFVARMRRLYGHPAEEIRP